MEYENELDGVRANKVVKSVLKVENKSTAAAALSLTSGVLFLFTALLLRIPQPLSLMMLSGVLTTFVAMFTYAYPQHHTLCGVIIIVFSLVSFLTIEVSAPWHHVDLWYGRIVHYQPDLSLHILSGIPPMILGITGGALAITHKIFEFQIEKTPKSFLKKCVDCGKEIPLASEQCPYCGSKQNRQK